MSQINVNTIRNRTGGAPSLDKGAVVTGIVTATTGQFAGDVTVGGVLTYEDVTNIDSTGIVTAKSGIKVGNPVSPGIGATIDPSGNAVFAGITTVGTAITMYASSGIVSATQYFGDGSKLTGIDATAIQTGNTSVQTVDTGTDGHIKLNTEGSERVRVGQLGQIGLGGANYGDSGQLMTSGGIGAAPTWSDAPSSAPEIEATASGAISANDAVIINSDGTVSKPTTIASVFGSKQEFTSNEPLWIDCCYEPVNNKVVVVYSDGSDSNRIKAIAGTVDGSNKTVTWGTAINLHTNTSYSCYYPRITETNDDGWCVVVWYSTYNSNRLKANSIKTSSSDNSLTLQANNQTYGLSINALSNAYTTTKTYPFDIAWNTGSGGREGGMVVQTNTGYTVTAKAVKISSDGTMSAPGNSMNLWTSMQHKNVAIAFNPDNNNYLVVAGEYQGDGGPGIDDWGTIDARVIYANTSDNVTVNTAGISVNDGYVGDPGIYDVSYAPKYKKFLVGYRWENNSGNGNIYGLLLDTNSVTTAGGTTQTIARGTSILVDDIIKTQSNFMLGGGIAFDEDKDCWVMSWRGANAPNAYGAIVGIVKYDGTSLSKVTAVSIETGNTRYFSNTYDPDTKTSIIAYQDSSNDGQVVVMVPESDTLRDKNFIGFAQAGYSNGATAKISVVGNQSTHSSLTPASIYYVQKDGTISTTADSPSVEAGIALSTTKLLIKG